MLAPLCFEQKVLWSAFLSSYDLCDFVDFLTGMNYNRLYSGEMPTCVFILNLAPA